MSTKNAGFTLIEVVLVTSLSGLLLVIALVGQHQLQTQARFDAAIDKLLQEFAYTRNYSLSNVNEVDLGQSTSWVVAGAELELADHHPVGELAELETWYCNPSPDDPSGVISASCLSSLDQLPGSVAACPTANVAEGECVEQPFSDPGIQLSGINEVALMYLNSGGGVRVCQPIINDSIDEITACSSAMSAPYTFTITDNNGLSANIQIDTSGYAKRL